MKKYIMPIFLSLAAVAVMGAGCQQKAVTDIITDEVKSEDAMMEKKDTDVTAGDSAASSDVMPKDDKDAMMEGDEVTKGDDETIVEEKKMMKDNDVVVEEESNAMMEDIYTYSGAVLAGSAAKLYDFNQTDYEAALKSDNLIVLYFYASWCPICKAETADALYPIFNELDNDNVIGFRVNFNDSDTDSNEEGLARQFGVAYQHTKVFVKNGERILKSPESWDKARYASEIEKNL